MHSEEATSRGRAKSNDANAADNIIIIIIIINALRYYYYYIRDWWMRRFVHNITRSNDVCNNRARFGKRDDEKRAREKKNMINK